jgi:hypothetical protein
MAESLFADFWLWKKIWAFPHSCHVDGVPCRTHVRDSHNSLLDYLELKIVLALMYR